jgi:hypothetical protein
MKNLYPIALNTSSKSTAYPYMNIYYLINDFSGLLLPGLIVTDLHKNRKFIRENSVKDNDFLTLLKFSFTRIFIKDLYDPF